MGEVVQAFEDPKFRRRFRELESKLDERVRFALETLRMNQQAPDENRRHVSWFICVVGTGHGHHRYGVRPLDEPPGCVSADEKKASGRSLMR